MPINTPGIPEELGASLYFENAAGRGANIQADGMGATLYYEDEGEGPGDYMDVPGGTGTKKLNSLF